MKRIFYAIKDKVALTYNIDLGVLILFFIVSIVFLISFINVYI